MKDKVSFGAKQKRIWGILLALVWMSLGLLFYRTHRGITAEELVNYRPENPWLGALLMLGLFCLKSVDFLLHSGVLYAANGIMYPPVAALFLNVAGILIMITPTYFIGRRLGPPLMRALKEKYPKLKALEHRTGNNLLIAVLLRSIGIPLHIGSLYMGAAQFAFPQYLLGSLLGLLPIMLPYMIMGSSASDYTSPAFRIALIAEILVSVLSVVIYAAMKKQQDAKDVL